MENYHNPEDPLNEVLFTFFALCDYDEVIISNFLVLFVGVGDEESVAVLKAVSSRFCWQ